MRPMTTLGCLAMFAAPFCFASDQTMRCGSALVTQSTPVEEFLQKCGQPTSKQSFTEDIRVGMEGGGTRHAGTTVKEVWTYDRGSGGRPYLVTVIDGKIKSIETGE